MVRLLSLPLIITASTNALLGLFFLMLQWRLRDKYGEAVKHYKLFVLLAFVSATFLGAFAVLMNAGDNLHLLDTANRITIITAMFTILLSVEFAVRFFHYTPPVSLKWGYGVNGVFTALCLVPSSLFLDKAFFQTSRYYTGLAFGPLFQAWGVWVVVISLYCILVLYLVFRRIRRSKTKQSVGPVLSLLSVTSIWLITGIGDDLTAIQIIDLPPLAWIGAFLITGCIAWILVLQIDTLYSERRALSRQLVRDHLTQISSRSFLEMQIAGAVRRLESQEIDSICLCIFDVDDFKDVNDTYGHVVGDEVLKRIAGAARSSIRQTDCAARFGGDEFAILLPGIPREPTAVRIVERIRRRVHECVVQCGTATVRVTCSFGISRVDRSHLNLEDLAARLLACADEALYDSKRNGKDTITSRSLVPSDPAEGGCT